MKPSSAALLSKIPPFIKGRKWQLLFLIFIIIILIAIYVVFFNGNRIQTQYFYISCYSDKNIVDSCDIHITMDYSDKKHKLQIEPSCRVIPYCNLAHIADSSWYNLNQRKADWDSIIATVNVQISVNSLLQYGTVKFKNIGITDDGLYYYKHNFDIKRDSFYNIDMVTLDANMYVKMKNMKHHSELMPLRQGILRSTSFKNNFWDNPRNTSSSCMNLKFENIETRKISLSIDYISFMNYMTLSPEPDEMGGTFISYFNKDKIDYILKNGLYVYSESLSNKRDYEMINFILATVIGCLFSMIIDLIYRIINRS